MEIACRCLSLSVKVPCFGCCIRFGVVRGHLMLALLQLAVTGVFYTYPVKSINLANAPAGEWFETFSSASVNQLSDVAATYGVATADGGFVICGAGGEGEGGKAESFALKASSIGLPVWRWTSGHKDLNDAAISCTQLPNGGDILVVGRYEIGGITKRSVTKLSQATGAMNWTTTDFGDSAGSFGAWETVDITSDGSAVLLSGWKHKTDTSPMGYRSGGNTFGGQAVVMKFPVSAMGATAPTSANAAWTKVWPNHNAAHAARTLSTGEIVVLLWTDEDPDAPKSLEWGAASVTKLNADGTNVWGPINQGSAPGKPNQEGTDLQISKDGQTIVVGGHGYCAGSEVGGLATVRYCGKTFGVSASDGSMTWNTEFSSCGVPNQCGNTLIKTECWGIQALSDGYVLSCGTGIENCDG